MKKSRYVLTRGAETIDSSAIVALFPVVELGL